MEDLQLELRQLKRMMDRKTEDGTVPHFPKETALLDFCAFIAEYKDAFFLSPWLTNACPETALVEKYSSVATGAEL